MAYDDVLGWKRLAEGPGGSADPMADIRYGPDVPAESELRLLGQLADKRVLELGCAAGWTLVALARKGAHAIGLDVSATQLASAKRLAEAEGVRVELHQGDLADLAFMRADSVDLVLSTYALALVDDLNRVFRQVHRVLKEGASLVFSLPHPMHHIVARHGESVVVRRSYFDRTPPSGPSAGSAAHHTFSELFFGLTRARFRIDAVLEPEPVEGPHSPWWDETARWVPQAIVFRAKKEGI